MSTESTLHAEIRTDLGKGASRRLRRLAGLVPAIVYGAGKEVQNITLQHNELKKRMKHESFYTQILSLTVAGAEEQVVIKDIQRHPYKPQIMHMDFLRIKKGEKITMTIPFHFVGEEMAPGVKQHGGSLSHTVTEAEISCIPSKLPEYIEVDVSKLDMDEVLHLSAITLADGVEFTTLTHGNDLAVANIHKSRTEASDDDSSSTDQADDSAATNDDKEAGK